MHSNRRDFIKSVGSVVVAGTAVDSVPQQVKPLIDIDLSVMALTEAIGKVGDGPYELHVHPLELGRARMVLCHTFPKNDWRRDFVIVPMNFRYVETWCLTNRRIAYMSEGA